MILDLFQYNQNLDFVHYPFCVYFLKIISVFFKKKIGLILSDMFR